MIFVNITDNVYEITPNTTVTGVAVSDLHEFHVGGGKRWQETHKQVVDECLSKILKDENIDFLILNGDIFEGYETGYNKKDLVKKIKEYITELNNKNTRNIPIIYVAGNHDDRQYIMNSLEKLAEEIENFFFHKEDAIIKMGKYILYFTHGDLHLRDECNPNERIPDHQMQLSFHKYLQHLPENSAIKFTVAFSHFYALLRPIIQPLIADNIHTPEEVTRKILEKMQEEQPELWEELKNAESSVIITGHTHNPFIICDLLTRILFANCGTAVHLNRLNPIVVTMSEAEIKVSNYNNENANNIAKGR